MLRVADWQLDNFERQSAEGSRYPDSHAYWSWVNAVMYVGLAGMTDLATEAKYTTFLQTVGRKTRWKPDGIFSSPMTFAWGSSTPCPMRNTVTVP